MKGPRNPEIRRAKLRPRTPEEMQAMLASALHPFVLGLATLLLSDPVESPEEWIRHDRSPLGARCTRELAKRGAFPGARKVGRRWLIPRAALSEYIEREGAAPSANDNAEEETSADVADLATKLGYALTPSKASARRKRR